MRISDMNSADLVAALRETEKQLETLAADLSTARQDKTALARQLTASQEELRRMGLFNARRNAKKAEITRLTEQYTAAAKQVTALENRVMEVTKQRLELQQRIEQLVGSVGPAEHLAQAPEAAALRPKAPTATVQEKAASVKSRAGSHLGKERLEDLLSRLEAWYPEHQVYALDSLCGDLRAKLSALAGKNGFESVPALLQAQGWQCIKGEAVLALRRGKHCIPGQEPEIIRPQVASMLHRLAEFYPDRVIPRSIQRDHKSLSQDVTGLYQWLGYESIGAMLAAYGYEYRASAGGRPATDADALVSALKAACASGERAASIQQLIDRYPEHAAAIKTLQNRAPATFGMTLRKYLIEQGVLQK